MKFSTKTTYGLRAVICLTKHYQKGSLPLASIAATEGISLKYLERIFALLKKAKIVAATKGSSGGYRLAKSPAKTSVLEVIMALEGNIDIFYCVSERGKVKCGQQCHCQVNKVLKKVQDAISHSLKNIYLSDLL